MTLVLRATRLGQVQIWDGSSSPVDVNLDPTADGVTNTGFALHSSSSTRLFNGSTWDRARDDLSFSQIGKSLPWYSRRVPRRTIVMDDFEAATLKWVASAGTPTRDTTAGGVFDGAASLKMVTGATAGNAADGLVYRGYMGLQKYVVELWWASTAVAATTPRRFFVRVVLYDGTNSHFLDVAYLKNLTTAQNKWQFSADGTTYSDVAGGAETLDVRTAVPYNWHYFRGHFNMSAATPNLDELHTDTLNLTGLTAAGQASASSTILSEFRVGGTTDAAAAATFLVDDVSISDQEA